jgi:hypothetical protein
VKKPYEYRLFGKARLDRRMNRMRECGLDSSHSGQRQVAGSCEHGNETYSTKYRKFLDWLRTS